MLSEKILLKLNDQLNQEIIASHIYLQASAWCNANGFEHSANFLRKHSDEEKDHMYRIYDYILKTGHLPLLDSIPTPGNEYASLKEVFKKLLESEINISQKINALSELCLNEKDFTTFQFLQWFVAEQHEEEHLIKNILEKFDLLDHTDPKQLYFLDKEMQNH